MEGPVVLRVSGSLVGWDRPDRRAGRVGGLSGGLVRFYKSQCKSRDKYYLLFEERHSRYLLYRGKGPGCLEHKFGLVQRKTGWVKRLDDYSAPSTSEHGLIRWQKKNIHPSNADEEQNTQRMEFMRDWGDLSCHFVVEFQSFPSMFEWLNSSEQTKNIYQTTLRPNVEMLQRFSLITFSGILWMKAVCTADVRKLGVVSDMLIQFESIWYEKQKTPVPAYCKWPNHVLTPSIMCTCVLLSVSSGSEPTAMLAALFSPAICQHQHANMLMLSRWSVHHGHHLGSAC